MRSVRTRQLYPLIGIALFWVVALPIGIAAAAGTPGAPASASVKKEIGKLKRRIAALESKASKAPAAALPAGGDLTGTYPNPLIGPAAVGNAEVADDAISGAKVQNGTLTSADLGTNSVDNDELAARSVGNDELRVESVGSLNLQTDSVGMDQLQPVTTVTSPGVVVNAGSPQIQRAQCPPGRLLVAGGHGWQDDEANSIIYSHQDENVLQTWVVRGMVDSGSNVLFAWASCLGA